MLVSQNVHLKGYDVTVKNRRWKNSHEEYFAVEFEHESGSIQLFMSDEQRVALRAALAKPRARKGRRRHVGATVLGETATVLPGS